MPAFTSQVDVLTERFQILEDSERTGSAVIKWASPLTDQFSSNDMFALLRRAFAPSTDEDRAVADTLNVFDMSGRTSIQTERWEHLTSSDPNFAKLCTLMDAATQQGKDTLRVLSDLSKADFGRLQGNVDVCYIPLTEAANRNPDIRGVHTDIGTLQFGAADRPGLIVLDKTNTLSRVDIVEDDWHVIKCGNTWTSPTTNHTVFGPEIVTDGRVSMIVHVWLGAALG